MKKSQYLLFALFIAAPVLAQKITYPKPSASQLLWQESEIGVVFHYDLHVFDGEKYNQAKNRIVPVEDYNIYNPKELDTDQWLSSAKAAGAKFAILTATHETGFANFQSEVNPYSMKALKFQDGKGDLVRDFVNSCRKYGLLPGIYVGIRWNSFLGVHDFRIEGESEFVKNRQLAYKRMCEGMVKELCTNYGDLFMIWFDGGADDPSKYGADVLPIVEKYQPNCLFYHNAQRADFRWGGSETGTVGYPCWSTFPFEYSHSINQEFIFADNFKLLKEGDPEGKYWMPAMADAPLRGFNGRHEWFWEPEDDAYIYPLENLMNMYEKSVGRNSTLILGLTPDSRGLMPDADVRRLEEFGKEINKRFSNPLAKTKGQGEIVTLDLGKTTELNQLIIQEDIADGERVRAYVIEVWKNKKWVQVASGQSVGYKRIQKIEAITTSKIRFRVLHSTDQPKIKYFSVFNN